MSDSNLILSIPQGNITATSLGIEGFARHRSPGSGKHFKGRKLLVELAVKDLQPDFEFLDEGGWRNPKSDTVAALAAAAAGNRTKTALSNNAFSCTPVTAYKQAYLVKTAGKVMKMDSGILLHKFKESLCTEEMSPDQVAAAAGVPSTEDRRARFYMVMCPIELLLISNLTPIEYAWYATHRPGKVFRQVVFTELHTEQPHLAAQSRYRDALQEITDDPEKKTKTIVSEDCMNELPFHSWLGYHRETEGGLYIANQDHIDLWKFPEEIPTSWERAQG